MLSTMSFGLERCFTSVPRTPLHGGFRRPMPTPKPTAKILLLSTKVDGTSWRKSLLLPGSDLGSRSSRDFERDILPMAKHFGMALSPWDVLGEASCNRGSKYVSISYQVPHRIIIEADILGRGKEVERREPQDSNGRRRSDRRKIKFQPYSPPSPSVTDLLVQPLLRSRMCWTKPPMFSQSLGHERWR
jgi:hypothetical protein